MIKEKHPSDSSEQLLAQKEILSLLNEKFQLNLESRKVLINDTLFQVDGYFACPPEFLTKEEKSANSLRDLFPHR